MSQSKKKLSAESEPAKEEIPIDPVKHRQDWLKRLADEYIKLESSVPPLIHLPDEGCPLWVQNLERQVGAAIFPVAKLKASSELTARRLGAIIGHQCSTAVWMMETLVKEIETPRGTIGARRKSFEQTGT